VDYIRKSIPYNRRHDLETDTVETICIELKIQCYTPFVLTFVYRPPNSKVVWFSNFERLLDNIDSFNYEIRLLGDFNINYLPNNVHKPFINSRWGDIVSKFGLKQLDLISEVIVSDNFVSDHFTIPCTYRLNNVKANEKQHTSLSYRQKNLLKKHLTEYKILRNKRSSLIKKKKRIYFNEAIKKQKSPSCI